MAYIINSNSNTLVSGTSGNDTIVNGGGKNITVEAGKGHDKFTNNGTNVKVYMGDGCDKVWNNVGSNVVINLGKGSDFAASEKNATYVTINGGDGNEIIHNHSQYSTVNGGAGNDTIYDNNSNLLLNGDDGNDVIVSGHLGNPGVWHYETYNVEMAHTDLETLVADTSADATATKLVTIIGGTGDDSIALGSKTSKHVVKYANGDGNDVIYGFNSGATLYITNGNYSTTKSGDDVIVKVGSGSITLKNAKDKTLNIQGTLDSGGGGSLPTGLTYNSDKTEITASKKFKGSSINLTKYPKVKSLDASAVTKKLKITGNSLDNEIKGGSGNDTISGGAGSDTLIGGKGNDVLTGGKGNDVFVYSKGNDVIKDYTAGQDKIELDGATIKNWKISGKDVIFTTTAGKITVKDGKGKKITITETKTYNSSSSALLAENNFATADNLSGIVKNNLTATDFKLEPKNFENLSQENLITFAAE